MKPTDRVEVFRAGYPDDPYPWMFRVHFQGRVIAFGGIPNCCATRRQAAARAGWRLRWLRLGTFDQHYTVPTDGKGKG